MSKANESKKELKVECNDAVLILSKNRTWLDLIRGEVLLTNPGRTEWRQRLIHSLLLWAEKDSSLQIMQFCMEFKITRSVLYAWAKKYKDIEEGLDYARLMIACHRQVGAMIKKLDGNYAYKDMHMYDPEWDAINKYHNDLKIEQEKQAHIFIIKDEKPKVHSKEELKEKRGQENGE